MKKLNDIKELLEQKYDQYNNADFIETDPISIPHQFTKKQDIEIAGFLVATIAWGQRKTIINNGNKLMRLMDNSPHDFILHHTPNDLKTIQQFVHRTFNGDDCAYFMKSLKAIYKKHISLEEIFTINTSAETIKEAIVSFRTIFLNQQPLTRTKKHISDPERKSSAKRLCMYLRWMVRNDKRGVDFGLWNTIKPHQLCLPLDVHTGNISRKLKLLHRKQNDWLAVEEITKTLKALEPKDPIKYDFALFGLGAFDKF